MAKCPKCGYSLKIWDVKAECPKCGVNIPNYDWENRLEQDSIKAEAAFAKLNNTLARLKYAFVGTKLRIARIPISVLPLFSFLLPLGTLSVSLPFMGDKDYTVNIITIIMNVFMKFDIGGMFGFATSDITGEAGMSFLLALVTFLLSMATLIVSLFFLIFNYKNLHSLGLFFTNLFGAIFMAASGYFYADFMDTMLSSTVTAVKDGGVAFGLFIGVALFLASSITNLCVAKSEVNLPEGVTENKTAKEKSSAVIE